MYESNTVQDTKKTNRGEFEICKRKKFVAALRALTCGCLHYLLTSKASAQATLCFLSLACSRALSLSHSISFSLSLACFLALSLAHSFFFFLSLSLYLSLSLSYTHTHFGCNHIMLMHSDAD